MGGSRISSSEGAKGWQGQGHGGSSILTRKGCNEFLDSLTTTLTTTLRESDDDTIIKYNYKNNLTLLTLYYSYNTNTDTVRKRIS